MTAPVASFELPRTETRVMRSADGHEHRVFIGSPLQPPPPDGYPIIYALDGNAVFATLVEAIRMRSHRPSVTGVLPALVVGLGYDIVGPYDRTARERDYVEGAQPFLEFIENAVKPAIARDYPVDAGRQTLYGHSLGGLFVVRTMASRPASFRSYVAVSPSIWRERAQLEAQIEALGSERRAPNAERRVPSPEPRVPSPEIDLMVAVGEYEQALAPWQEGTPEAATIADRRATRRMVDDAREFAGRVTALEQAGIRVRFELFAGEDHASVGLVAINRALRFALAPKPGNFDASDGRAQPRDISR